jgi:hypothetical protein
VISTSRQHDELNGLAQMPFSHVLGKAVSEAQVIVVADSDHKNPKVSFAALDPAAVDEAARKGAQNYLVESMSSPAVEAIYRSYKEGRLGETLAGNWTEDMKTFLDEGDMKQWLRDATARNHGIPPTDDAILENIASRIHDNFGGEGDKYVKTLVPFFQALKKNHMNLLSVSRNFDDMETAKEHPEFVQLIRDGQRIGGTEGIEAFNAFAKKAEQDMGPQQWSSFLEWQDRYYNELHEMDLKWVGTLPQRIGNEKTVIVWGSDDVMGPSSCIGGKLDKLGINNNIIGVYADQNFDQLNQPQNGGRNSKDPNYVYYADTHQGGQVDPNKAKAQPTGTTSFAGSLATPNPIGARNTRGLGEQMERQP